MARSSVAVAAVPVMMMACVVAFRAIAVPASAAAALPETYTYTVEHPSFGNIGTFSDTVVEDGDVKRIDSRLRIAVRILGIVVHREEADRTEVWRAGRLSSFHSITTVNGEAIEVNGTAERNGFVITSPTGTTVAPANIFPSSPWVRIAPDQSATMMSTKTGKVMPVHAFGGEPTVVSAAGGNVPVHHFELISDKRQDVWVDGNGVPVRFRTEQGGKPVDFVLTRP